jgi:hypothetical protein
MRVTRAGKGGVGVRGVCLRKCWLNMVSAATVYYILENRYESGFYYSYKYVYVSVCEAIYIYIYIHTYMLISSIQPFYNLYILKTI